MSNARPASGSRWEPPADPADPGLSSRPVEAEPDASAPIPSADIGPETAADTTKTAADATETTADATTEAVATPHDASGFAPLSYDATAWSAASPTTAGFPARHGRVRRAVAAAALLLLGGVGGFWLGHTTAPGPTAATAGVGAHQHRDRGGDGDRFAPNGDGQAPGAGPQAPGNGSAQAPGAAPGTGVSA